MCDYDSRYLEGLDEGPEEQPILTDTCPAHGEQMIEGFRTVGRIDPYAANELACGCIVICFGPNEPNVITGTFR